MIFSVASFLRQHLRSQPHYGFLAAAWTLLVPTSTVATESLTAIVAETIETLEDFGFQRQNILEKPATQGGLEFVLLRLRSQQRIYDMSIFSRKQAYLSVSYDDGRNFSKASRFDRLDSLLRTVQKIETRERSQLGAGGVYDGTGDKSSARSQAAEDQAAGLEEAAAKQKQLQQAKQSSRSAADQLNAVVKDVASGQSTSDAGSIGQDNAKLDLSSRQLAKQFGGGGNSCFPAGAGVAGTAAADPAGGLVAAAKQISDAAIATALATAFALNTQSDGEILVDGSRFLETRAESDELAKLLAIKDTFAGGSDTEKTALLKEILSAVIDDKDSAVTRQYRSIRALASRFKKWASGEGMRKRRLQRELRFLIANLSMDQKTFSKAINSYPIEQRQEFVVDAVKRWIFLNPNAPNPEAASIAFFNAAMIYLKGKSLDISSIHKQLRDNNLKFDQLSNESFAQDQQELEEARKQQMDLFMMITEKTNQVKQLLEGNPVVP